MFTHYVNRQSKIPKTFCGRRTADITIAIAPLGSPATCSRCRAAEGKARLAMRKRIIADAIPLGPLSMHTAPCSRCGVNDFVCCSSGTYNVNEDGKIGTTFRGPVCPLCCGH